MTRIGITGAQGFIGQHMWFFLHPLEKEGKVEVITITREQMSDEEQLISAVRLCDVIIHLAGINRTECNKEFEKNVELAERLVRACNIAKATPVIVYASSLHIEKDTPYGRSKKRAGELLLKWGREVGARVCVLVLPHVFGEFAKPFYNSAIATLCYQMSESEEFQVNPGAQVELIHARDVVARMYATIKHGESGLITVSGEQRFLQNVYETLSEFKQTYENGVVPSLTSHLDTQLFTTLHSYLFWKLFPRQLEMRADQRGDLVEIVRHNGAGQAFFSTTVPGAMRGNHYHTRKIERFCVLKGTGEIRIRRLLDDHVHTFDVSGEKPVIVDMPTYYTHSLVNTGSEDLYGAFWVNEQYNPDDPDTYYEDI